MRLGSRCVRFTDLHGPLAGFDSADRVNAAPSVRTFIRKPQPAAQPRRYHLTIASYLAREIVGSGQGSHLEPGA